MLRLVVVARALDPAIQQRIGRPDKTAAIVNTEKTPTILTLLGQDDFNPRDLEQTIVAAP